MMQQTSNGNDAFRPGQLSPSPQTSLVPDASQPSGPGNGPIGTDEGGAVIVMPSGVIDLGSIASTALGSLASMWTVIVPVLFLAASVWCITRYFQALLEGWLFASDEYGEDGTLTPDGMERQYAAMLAIRRRRRIESELEAFEDPDEPISTGWRDPADYSEDELDAMSPLERRVHKRMSED